MLELKTPIRENDDSVLATRAQSAPREQSQRRMMLVALGLLLVALAVVIFHDRDFWFPDTADADDLDPVPATVTIETQPNPVTTNSTAIDKSGKTTRIAGKHQTKSSIASAPNTIAASAASPVTSNARTVLPPLEVEVVAGNYHRQVRPGANSLRVDLQSDTLTQKAPVNVAVDQNAANMTTNAAENLHISAEAADVLSQPVRPGYPVLARQMKVQGSVILQAMIGRDGLIQDLHVMTGPPILADAAERAVRQWRFKPHYLNNQPVETQTSITVNFTISTN